MERIKPQGNRCLIEIEKIEQTKSGLILSSTQDIIIETAKVKAIGSDVKIVKVGDKIMFKSWAIDSIRIDKESYDFISEDDIIAIIK